MSDTKDESIAMIKRAALRREQLDARFEAAERQMASWPFRIKWALMQAMIFSVIALATILFYWMPDIYPHDVDALKFLLVALLLIFVMFAAAAIVEEWIDAQTKWVGLWCLLARAIFLSACIGLVVGASNTAELWLPHFQWQ